MLPRNMAAGQISGQVFKIPPEVLAASEAYLA